MKTNEKRRALRFAALILTVCSLATMLMACKPEAPIDPTVDEPKEETLTVTLDLTQEWDKVFEPGSLVQGCIVVRKAFAEQYPAVISAFLAEYERSVDYVKENPQQAAAMIVSQGIFAKEAVAAKAIPNCNIEFMSGDEMRSAMGGFLATMMNVAPASIGGALPGDDFYYAPDANADLTAVGATTVNVSVLNGTTGFGIAPLMQQSEEGTAAVSYHFNVETDASNITAALIKGDVDIAALPTNAAATLYNKTNGEIQLLAINTQGVLYLLDKGNGIDSIADLKGKTVYAPAQNPTFIFKAICEANGLKVGAPGDTDADVIIDNKYTSPAELQTNVAAGTVTLAVLPEPMVTIALSAANQSSK